MAFVSRPRDQLIDVAVAWIVSGIFVPHAEIFVHHPEGEVRAWVRMGIAAFVLLVLYGSRRRQER